MTGEIAKCWLMKTVDEFPALDGKNKTKRPFECAQGDYDVERQ